MNRKLRNLVCCLGLALLGGCQTPWTPLHEGEGWTLYVQDAERVDTDRYQEAFEAARVAVEDALGPFEDHVRVFAWHGGVDMRDGSTRGTIEHEEIVQNVPGIGPAKVEGFHARGGDLLGRSGVFLGKPDVGTTVHELVHARLAEHDADYPLWFEEGVAHVMGDGIYHEGAWCMDGLACWPLRELGEERLNDKQLELLLSLSPGDTQDMRTNVLVHFFGWAIVFDVYREEGKLDWKTLKRFYEKGITVAEARRRMERTLSRATATDWLERLEHPDPAVRLGAVKGIWKLRSREVASVLAIALREEEHPEVKAAIAINLMSTAAETRVGWRTRRRMWRSLGRALRDPDVPDPIEREALQVAYRYYAWGGDEDRVKQAIEDLSRFLDE